MPQSCQSLGREDPLEKQKIQYKKNLIIIFNINAVGAIYLIGSIIHKSDAPTQHWLFVHCQ